MMSKKWMFLIVVMLMSCMSLIQAQTNSILISLPIRGQLAFYNPNGNLFLADTFTGQSSLIVSYTGDDAIDNLIWSPHGDRIAFYHRRGSDSTIFNVGTMSSEEIASFAYREGLFYPLSWFPDEQNILYLNYFTNSYGKGVYSIDIVNINDNSLTTLFSHVADDILADFPVPEGINQFKFSDIANADLNPAYPEWMVLQLNGSDPTQIVTEETGTHERVVRINVLWNYVTGEILSLDSLFSESVDQSTILVWKPDGNYLLIPTFYERNFFYEVVRFRNENEQWSLERITRAQRTQITLHEWLGIGGLFVTFDRTENDDYYVYQIGEIINGTWYSTEFFRISKIAYPFIRWGDWYPTPTQEERYSLSCLFDQALSTRLSIGTRGRVNLTSGTPLRLRAEPSFDASEIMQMPEGTEFNIIGGKACVNSSDYYRFWQLQLDNGTTGWAAEANTAEYFIEPVSTVACSVTVPTGDELALSNAIVTANNEPTPQTLCLEGIYELTSSNNSSADGANGLPVITGDITLVGINGGATITRNSASQFRIAKVASGGRLVLNGITISNGNPGSQNGGGIRNLGTLEIINSVITGNTSNDGGGIRNNDNATLIITGSTISNNTSTGSGGGVYSNTDSITTITDTDFINNQANPSSGLGGAIFVKSPNLSISGGVFDSNSARNGGAIFFGQPTAPTVTLTGVSITNNTANNHGGGVYVSTGTVVMDNVTIAGNEADSIGGGIRNGANLTIQNNSMIQDNYGGDSQGGGIINYSSLTLHDTQLIGNYGDTATLLGGAIYNDGTLIIDEGSLIDGTSTTVSINARHGGGIYADGGTVTISDSQIVNNVANVDGGGIMVRSGTTLNATGVTLDNNTANDDGGGLANEGTFTFTNGSIRNNHAADRGGGVDSTTATNNFIHYSCLEGNTAANRTAVYSGASNFDATNNWWGSTSGATSSQVNSNVVKTPFVNSNCADALAMGGGAMAAMQSSTSTTIQTVSAPYETIFDERAGWLRSGTWAQEANGGRASTGWVVDATIRNMISTLEMPVFVNLGNNPNPRVRFWQRGMLSSNDTLVLEILPQGATTWTILDQQSNFNSDWTQREIDLTAYRGQAIRLRWRLTTAGDVPAEQSSIDYAIDDLQITSRR